MINKSKKQVRKTNTIKKTTRTSTNLKKTIKGKTTKKSTSKTKEYAIAKKNANGTYTIIAKCNHIEI